MATLATNFTSCWAENVKSYPGAEGEPCFGIKWQHMTLDCPQHVV